LSAGPLIVQSFGFDQFQTILFQVGWALPPLIGTFVRQALLIWALHNPRRFLPEVSTESEEAAVACATLRVRHTFSNLSAVQVIAILGSGYLTTRFRRKSPVLLALLVPCSESNTRCPPTVLDAHALTLPAAALVVGGAILHASGRSVADRGKLLAAYYLIMFYTVCWT
jgi:hypothetical protein